ncbi:MAG: ABC transporter substrate-binding protein [Fimbriimonas sp.]
MPNLLGVKLGALTLPLLGAGVVATAVTSEIVAKPEVRPGPVRITYWEKWTGFEGDAIRDTVNTFNKSQDKIFVDLLIVSTVDQKALMATAAGVPPDVVGLYGTNVAQFADDQALVPLDKMCEEAGIVRDNYVPVFYDIGVYNGKVYALPTTPATTALHYNTAMLKEVGVEKPPQTIEAMTELADKLTKRGDNGKITRSGFLPAEPGWWNWGWGTVFGGKLWDGKETLTTDSPEMVRGYKWLRGFSERYGPGELQSFRSGFGNFSSPQNAFMAEQVAMVLQGVWMYNFIDKFNPKLQWAAVPFPHPADRPDLANHTYADMDVIVIPRGSKHPKEAFEFIKFLQSQKGMEQLCLLQRKISPLSKVSVEFYAKHPNPYIKLFYDLSYSKNAIPPPKLGLWPQLLAEMNNAFDEVTLMTSTPEGALKKVKTRMQPLLTDYLKRLKLREQVVE